MRTRAHTDSGNVRCFLALVPDSTSRDKLRRYRLEHTVPPAGSTRGVRWVDTASLHLTLRFLGESSGAQIEYFKHMLPTLAQSLPAVAARRCAIWPNRARPRLLVLELDTSDALRTLVCECEILARKNGHDPEPRAFRPHMTLARLRPGCALGNLPPPPTPMVFEAITLMQSTLSQPAAVYRELARVPLTLSAMQP